MNAKIRPDAAVGPDRRAQLLTKLPMALLGLTILLGTGLRLVYFDTGLVRTPDERVYARQANVILAQGLAGYHTLGAELARDPSLALYPSPVRAGYIGVLAAFMIWTGNTSVLAGAFLSLLCDLCLLALVAWIGYRWFSPAVAIVATLSLAVFPFDLVVYRRGWEESYIALMAMATVWLAAWIAREPSARILKLAGFAVLGVAALSTKENSGATFLFCAAGLTVYFLLANDRRGAVLTACSAALAGLIYLSVMSALFGGISSFLHLEHLTLYTGVNPYIQEYDTGPAWMFPAALFRTSPFLFLAALSGGMVAARRTWRARALSESGLALGMAVLTFLILVLEFATTHYAFRFAAPVYGSICLLAGIGVASALPALHRLLAPLGRGLAWAVLGFAISSAALGDLDFARNNFLLPGLPDLALRPVLGVPPLPLPPAVPNR